MLRMINGDFGNGTLMDEGSELDNGKDEGIMKGYGLEDLEGMPSLSKFSALTSLSISRNQLTALSQIEGLDKMERINMVDLGGNVGAVSIAAFKMYPTQLRAVTIEPIPSTYFLLRWNMWMNGVPALEMTGTRLSSSPGVLALNGGVVTKKRKSIEVCYTPPNTLMGQVCKCKSIQPGEEKHCYRVKGFTVRSMVDIFGRDPIAMVKMDCEGCEFSSLPALMQIVEEDPQRIRRLSGELHWPTRHLEDIACQFESGKFLYRLCSSPENIVEKQPVSCSAEPKICGGAEGNYFMGEIRKALDA